MSGQSMYQWPSRKRSSTVAVNVTPARPARLTPFQPPTRPTTTPPARPTTSFGAAVIHTTPPPKSRAQHLAAIDPARIGPTRMPSYVGGLLDAFNIDNLGETSLDLDLSFEVSPRSAPDPLPYSEDVRAAATTSTSEESFSRPPSPEPAPTVQFEGLSLSFPERPFSLGSMPEFHSRTPSPPPSRPRTPTPRRIRLDSSAFEKPPQSFSSVSLSAGQRRRSCILDCVKKGVKRATRKDA